MATNLAGVLDRLNLQAPQKKSVERVSEADIAEQMRGMVAAGYSHAVDKAAFCKLAEFLAYRVARRNRRGVLLCGSPGTGKTLWLSLFSGCRIISALDIAAMVAEHSEAEALRRIFRERTLDIYPPGTFDLAFDDIGAEPTLIHYGTRMETIANVLQRAYDRWKRGIGIYYASTNLSLEELLKRYDDRTASRIDEMFFPVVFTGEDQRRTA